MIVKDFYCAKCQIAYENVTLKSHSKRVECPECGNPMEWVPRKMSFKPVPGGHNDEYKK